MVRDRFKSVLKPPTKLYQRQDEALARDGVSREVPCSALKGEWIKKMWYIYTMEYY